ncbi:MAG TPA: hypothetical protein VMN82_11135, partial [Thermoanaerobaculia bacterium]|nr:hypothetical protein [Thermoanaerobaculia bacterium]
MKRNPWRLVLAAVAALVAPSAPLRAQAFSTIDYPGATETRVFGMNDLGDAVGRWVDAGGVTHGFLLHGGRFTAID